MRTTLLVDWENFKGKLGEIFKAKGSMSFQIFSAFWGESFPYSSKPECGVGLKSIFNRRPAPHSGFE